MEALRGGLILGVALFLWGLIAYFAKLDMNYGGLVSFIQFLILAGAIYYFARRQQLLRGAKEGFSYGQCLGFILALMLCTGFMYGLGQFFLQGVIDPQYYADLTEAALIESNLDDQMVEMATTMMSSPIMKNPFVYLFSGIFTMLIYGGLIGLIVSAFVKRPADPFAESQNHDEE